MSAGASVGVCAGALEKAGLEIPNASAKGLKSAERVRVDICDSAGNPAAFTLAAALSVVVVGTGAAGSRDEGD